MKKGSSFFLPFVLAALLAACSPQEPAPENHQGHEQTNQKAFDAHGEHGNHGEQTTPEIDTEAVFDTGNAKAMDQAVIRIRVQDKQGKPIEEFAINHEKKMHLILVSKDLSYIQHIHPEYKGNGMFEVQNRFPAGGEYKAFADYVPSGGTQQVKSQWLNIEGAPEQEKPLQPESTLTKIIEGKEVTLAFDNLKSNQDVTMTFTIREAATKQPISNLEPYLGAVGHVVVLDRKAETYLHVHPLDEKAKGPSAKFVTNFPTSGVYKIWGQFQHEGKVFTVPFVIEVP